MPSVRQVNMYITWLWAIIGFVIDSGALILPDESRYCDNRPGDLLLGYVYDDWSECFPSNIDTRIARMEAFKYAVGGINNDANILPNITLGYVILDPCTGAMGSVSAILHLVPSEETPDARDVATDCTSGIAQYRVVGALGPSSSRETSMTAPIMGTVQVPILSTYATSDDLSDRSRYEYLVRLSPPDQFQTQAILQLLAHFNWTYFGLIYSEGTYGENGAKYIEKGAHARHLCIAQSEIIYADTSDSDIANILWSFDSKIHLRAIILFADMSVLTRVFANLDTSLYGRFIWVGSDAMGFDTYGDPAHGALVVHFPSGTSPLLDGYISDISPSNTNSVLLNEYWQAKYGCLWNCTLSDCTSCHVHENETLGVSEPAALVIQNAVQVLAVGLDELLSTYCPDAFSNNSVIADCITGDLYLRHILNVTINTTSGQVAFSPQGHSVSNYVFKQYSALGDSNVEVGYWNQDTNTIEMQISAINWTMFEGRNDDRDSEYNGNTSGEHDRMTPLSVCSLPCGARQYYIQREQPCCWDCHFCRENEIIVDHMTACEPCPTNFWPDDSALSCKPIPPEYLSHTSSIGAALTSINTLLVVLSILTTICLIKNRNAKLIRASSRSLMGLIMVGIFLAIATVYITCLKPTASSCFVTQLGFNVSVATVYSPLLMKTNRVYRIFAAGRKGKAATMVSTSIQVACALFIITIQIILVVTTNMIASVEASVRMPVFTDDYSELYCHMPVAEFNIPLCFNLVLLFLCGTFGYLTRSLPENFNEAWYIFVSVATTVFLWMVFLPTYFTAFYAVHQTALLATCLVMNATITLLCLFVPKVYALYFVKEQDMKCVTMVTATISPSSEN